MTIALYKIMTFAYIIRHMKILNDIKNKFGTQNNIAKAFEVEQAAVAQWYSRGRLPLIRAKKAAELVGRPVDEVLNEFYE